MDTYQLGDPDPLGIAITIAYAIATLLCCLTSAANWKGATNHAVCWLGLAIVYALLGINKQADLQTLLTDHLRSLAREEGWYPRRREYQALFAWCSVAAGTLLIIGLASLARRLPWTLTFAAIGASLQITYVCLRIVSLHHVDHWISRNFHRSEIQFLELAGAVVCAVAASVSLVHFYRKGRAE